MIEFFFSNAYLKARLINKKQINKIWLYSFILVIPEKKIDEKKHILSNSFEIRKIVVFHTIGGSPGTYLPLYHV